MVLLLFGAAVGGNAILSTDVGGGGMSSGAQIPFEVCCHQTLPHLPCLQDATYAL